MPCGSPRHACPGKICSRSTSKHGNSSGEWLQKEHTSVTEPKAKQESSEHSRSESRVKVITHMLVGCYDAGRLTTGTCLRVFLVPFADHGHDQIGKNKVLAAWRVRPKHDRLNLHSLSPLRRAGRHGILAACHVNQCQYRVLTREAHPLIAC